MFFNTFVNQRFIKMFKKNAKKSPYIFGVYVIKSYFCTRFRELIFRQLKRFSDFVNYTIDDFE